MHDEGMRLLSKGTGFYLRQWITARIRKYCYAQAAGTLNYSTAAYDILPSYGVRKEQIHVTYNSTDTEALLKEKRIRTGSPSTPSPVRPSTAAHRTARKMETGRFIDRGFLEGSRRLSGKCGW